jgi:hypothetical protein
MLNIIIKAAETIRAKHKLEIDGCIDKVAFFRAKFKNDQQHVKRICKGLYKKIK